MAFSLLSAARRPRPTRRRTPGETWLFERFNAAATRVEAGQYVYDERYDLVLRNGQWLVSVQLHARLLDAALTRLPSSDSGRPGAPCARHEDLVGDHGLVDCGGERIDAEDALVEVWLPVGQEDEDVGRQAGRGLDDAGAVEAPAVVGGTTRP